MKRSVCSIPVAALVLLGAFVGCGEKHEISGQRLESPPVAPLAEPTGGAVKTGAQETGDGRATQPQAGDARPNQARLTNWPFRPTSLRLHPLTHALRNEGTVSVVEARVEFFDRFGHTTKGLGRVRFELRAGDGDGRRLASWEIDVREVEENMRHYDDVTRTYLFRLGLEGVEDLPDSALLEVVAVMPDQRLTGSMKIALR